MNKVVSKDSQPIQYQRGYVEFYKLKFKVNPDVLIPRPETELLVDIVLELLKTHPASTVLDVGTGSGNIAISIAKNAPDVKIIATDVDSKALSVAKQNAKLHGISDKIQFIQSNLLSSVILNEVKDLKMKSRDSLQARNDKIDIIVANLPYIPTSRIPTLDSSVKDFEPYLALNGGKDGFELYRKLFAQIKEKNWKIKLFVGEIDETHGEIAVNEAKKYFPDAEVRVKKDLTGRQRILTVKLLGW